MNDLVSDLEVRYCPRVDSALLQAIVADFDLTDPQSLEAVHETLSALEAAAFQESERTGNDITGSVNEFRNDEPGAAPASDNPSQVDPKLCNNEPESFPDTTDTDTKVAILQEVFPDFSSFDISYTLAKCNNDWQRALDSLLNQQYLAADTHNDPHRPLSVCRGVDGFSEDHKLNQFRKRRVKGRPKNRTLNRQRSNSAPEVDCADPSAWGSIANKNLSPTGLVPQYTALALDDDETHDPSSSTFASVAGTGTSQYRQLAHAHSAAYQAALEQARAAYRKSRSNRLMGEAAAYYSQIGRDHAQASRGYTAAAADALVSSSSTPGSNLIDLHGVNVQDAVRISKSQVKQWWSSLGEDKVNGRIGAGTRAQGFTIITGVGRHSEGGRGKLGPAVKQALAADGWRVEVNTGSILVKGKAVR